MTSITKITVPDIGDFNEVEIIELNTGPGKLIEVDDPIITVESDKASMEIPCSIAGKIIELKVDLGDNVSAGDLIAILEVVENSEQVHDEQESVPEKEQVLQSYSAPDSKIAPDNPSTNNQSEKQPVERAITRDIPKNPDALLVASGPSVRRMAREFGVDLTLIKGTGRRGRLLKEDVKTYVKSSLSQSTQSSVSSALARPSYALPDVSVFGSVRREDMTKVEKVTSTNMQRAWNMVPHAWIQHDVDITQTELWRKASKAMVPKLTMTAIIIKAVANCLVEYPRFNAVIDNETLQIIYREYINVGVAIDTPRGLVIGVIKNAEQLNLTAISNELIRLSQLGREGKLGPKDMQGSCITISNLGGFGTSNMQPMVNWPEVAIIGVAASKKQSVRLNDLDHPNHQLIMPLILGFNHQVINGADGARFMSRMQSLIENPLQFLL